MEPWKVVILCWLAGSIGFVIGAAWCGFFRTGKDEPQPGPPASMPSKHPQ